MAATAAAAVLLALRDWLAGTILPIGVLGALAVAGGRSKHRRWVAAAVCAGYPLLLDLSVVVTWLVGWAVLGHPPRISQDDPKFISLLVDVPFGITFVLMLGLIPSAFAALWLAAFEGWEWWTARRRGSAGGSARRLALVLLGTPAAWALFFGLNSWWVGDLWDWFID